MFGNRRKHGDNLHVHESRVEISGISIGMRVGHGWYDA